MHHLSDDRPLRFLFVSAFREDRDSGAAGTLLALGDALAARGHGVRFLWGEEPHVPAALARASELVGRPGRQLRQVVRGLAAGPADVVSVSQPYAFRVLEHLARRPGVVRINRSHGVELRAYAVRRALAGEDRGSTPGLGSRIAERLLSRYTRRCLRACDAFLAPSSRCADLIRRRYPDDAAKVEVARYGVGPELLAAGADPGPRRAGALLYVGQYLPLKGAAVLERTLPGVAREVPEATLTFVVPPEAVARVAAAFGPAWGGRLAVLPWRSRGELVEIYRASDVLLFPSLFEGFGKTFLEAMACGLCVVGFAEGGLPDLAVSGREALFCPVGDALGFAALVREALARPDRTRRIGAAAAAVASRWTWDRAAEQIEALCRGLRARRDGPEISK